MSLLPLVQPLYALPPLGWSSILLQRQPLGSATQPLGQQPPLQPPPALSQFMQTFLQKDAGNVPFTEVIENKLQTATYASNLTSLHRSKLFSEARSSQEVSLQQKASPQQEASLQKLPIPVPVTSRDANPDAIVQTALLPPLGTAKPLALSDFILPTQQSFTPHDRSASVSTTDRSAQPEIAQLVQPRLEPTVSDLIPSLIEPVERPAESISIAPPSILETLSDAPSTKLPITQLKAESPEAVIAAPKQDISIDAAPAIISPSSAAVASERSDSTIQFDAVAQTLPEISAEATSNGVEAHAPLASAIALPAASEATPQLQTRSELEPSLPERSPLERSPLERSLPESQASKLQPPPQALEPSPADFNEHAPSSAPLEIASAATSLDSTPHSTQPAQIQPRLELPLVTETFSQPEAIAPASEGIATAALEGSPEGTVPVQAKPDSSSLIDADINIEPPIAASDLDAPASVMPSDAEAEAITPGHESIQPIQTLVPGQTEPMQRRSKQIVSTFVTAATPIASPAVQTTHRVNDPVIETESTLTPTQIQLRLEPSMSPLGTPPLIKPTNLGSRWFVPLVQLSFANPLTPNPLTPNPLTPNSPTPTPLTPKARSLAPTNGDSSTVPPASESNATQTPHDWSSLSELLETTSPTYKALQPSEFEARDRVIDDAIAPSPTDVIRQKPVSLRLPDAVAAIAPMPDMWADSEHVDRRPQATPLRTDDVINVASEPITLSSLAAASTVGDTTPAVQLLQAIAPLQSGQAAKVDELQLDRLAQVVYRFIQERFLVEQERGGNPCIVPPIWSDAIFSDGQTESKSRASSDVSAIDTSLQKLAAAVYVQLQQRLEIDRERHGTSYAGQLF